MRKGTVLSIDDDENLQTVISQYLEDDGYTVLKAGDASSALEQTQHNNLDVILLDLVLPDAEGITLIPQFKNTTQAGIIVVSGKNDTTEKIICLEMGADDYLTKPFEMRELSARITAVTRRVDKAAEAEAAADQTSNNSESEKIKFGNGCYLDKSQYQGFDSNGQSLDLTTGEFELLAALLASPNRALSREKLFELTRDGEFDAYDRAIDIQIGRIRKKLNDKDGNLIKTVRGIGYMYAGEISDA